MWSPWSSFGGSTRSESSRPDKRARRGALVERLGRSFFSRYTPDVAQELLGCLLVRRIGRRTLSGRIVEVEAYRGRDDPASHSYRGATKRSSIMYGEAGVGEGGGRAARGSHSYRGATKRSSIMYGEAGRVYVFFSYGVHWCLNFTTEAEGQPGAVLIRALEPVGGMEQMAQNRGVAGVERLTNGPGKLTRALSIDGSFN